ncbi:MAG: TolC family protein [Proteobacteria bacterium]|nr:TolC family protein [Pseudomonadota bacterium]
MLKITVEGATQPFRMRLEGKLAGPWVDELERCWADAVKTAGSGECVVDLRGVTSIAPEGRLLLACMHRKGARFEARGPLNCTVIDQICKGVVGLTMAFLLSVIPARGADMPVAPGQPLRLTLKDAVTLTLKQNPRVILSQLDTDFSEQQRRIARSGLLPQASLSVNQHVLRGNIETNFGSRIPGFPQHIGPFWVSQAGPTFSAPVFDLTLLRRYQASKEGIKVSQAREVTAREEAVLLVVSQYLTGQRAAAEVQAAQSRVELAQNLFNQASDLQKAGVGTGIDTLRARVELQNEKQRLIVAQTQRDSAIFALARLLGVDARQQIELADSIAFFQTPEYSAEQTVDEAFGSRPELQEIAAQRKRLDLEKSAARASRLPRLSVNGAFAEAGLSPTNAIPTYQYQAGIDIPLFTGGRIGAETAQVEIEQRRLKEQETDVRNRISVEVKTAVAQLNAARNEVEVANLGVKLATEEVEQAQDRFKAGVANNIEVISAQDALSRANDNQIAALYRYNQARADLARSTGRMETLYGR